MLFCVKWCAIEAIDRKKWKDGKSTVENATSNYNWLDILYWFIELFIIVKILKIKNVSDFPNTLLTITVVKKISSERYSFCLKTGFNSDSTNWKVMKDPKPVSRIFTWIVFFICGSFRHTLYQPKFVLFYTSISFDTVDQLLALF